MKELMETQTIEEKPLLRIAHKIDFTYSRYENEKNLMNQISLPVREVDFGRKDINVDNMTFYDWGSMVRLDVFILNKLSALGALRKISRLDVTIPDEDYAKYLWKKIIPAMELQSLGVTVVVMKEKYR